LDDLELSPSGIALEITEGVLLNANDLTTQQLSQLRKHGVGLSLDDFGTGYSSLTHLHDYDMDSIKIDQAFVKGLHFGSREYHLCKSIVLMAHELGLDVIAEGVETREQEELLRNLGCDYAQGYHLGRPMSARALGERLAREVA
jgi:EAL domain-containing protein (putative c-di-GMP-specific phosphodiesterase class I)